MEFFDENLYFYFVSLKTGFLNFDEYKEWLNEQFLSNESHQEILLDLEFCTDNIEKTIETMRYYLFNRLNVLNYHIFGKMLANSLKLKYGDNNVESLQETTKKLYQIWCLLPNEIAEIKPFIIMNSIDDLWACINEKQVIQGVNWLSHYYDN